jgi:WD40 repeat protein
VALRADYYGRFAAYPGLADLLGGNHVLVGPMQASELRRAIELPAARVGLEVERELADVLVNDVEDEPGALPLLSTALLELWQKRDGNALTLAAYRESGGVDGAVARLAESTYARVRHEQQPLVRALLLRLVGEGEGDAAVRRRASLAEFDLEHNAEAERVLAILADSRLVTVSGGSVEVAHEALLREWPRLREWIEEDVQGRRLRRHITAASNGWAEAGRDDGELLRGARLVAALDWSTDHAFELNELERAFVTESREVSEQETKRARRTNRRLRALLAGVAVLLAAAIAGGIFAVVQRGEARGAETAQVAQRLGAQALVEEDLDLSLLLARQAVAIDDSPQTRGYLLADLLRAPAVVRILNFRGDANLNTPIMATAVSPDGKTLAVGGPSVGLRFFDTRTNEQIGEPLVDAEVAALAYSPDGDKLAFGGDGSIRLIDTRTRRQLAEEPIARAGRVIFTSDGSRLAVVESTPESDGWITIRDASTLQQIGPEIQPEGFKGLWLSQYWADLPIALTPDGGSLVTTSAEGELTWWDLDSREKTRTLPIANGYRALAFSPEGRTAAIGLDDGIQLIDMRTGGVQEARGILASNPNWLLFSPDGKSVVSTARDGTVTVWDVESLTPRETLRGHSDAVLQPAFSPDGRTLYTTSHDGTAIAWDMSRNRRFGRPFTFTHDEGAYNWPDRHPGKFSPDGRLIAVGLKGEGIELRNAKDPTEIVGRMKATGGEVTALAFSPDAQTLAAVTRSGNATVWDVEARSLRKGPFSVDTYWVGASISADGTMLATAGQFGVTLWNIATGATLGSIGDGFAAGDVTFSPTGPLVAFVRDGYQQPGGGNAEVWDVARLSRVATMETDSGDALGWVIAFSPDGRMLATGGADALVHLWDVRSGKLVRELEQNVGNAVWSLEFSPDGSVLAMSGGDAFASLWDVGTGTPIGPRLKVGGREAMLDLSPDGRRLLMTNGDGEGALWDIDPGSWAQRACALANRTLTRQEWAKFLPGRRYEPACR